jgi:hypothetical protein
MNKWAFPKSEHFLNIVNGTPRLANLRINVNGKHFEVGHPAWQRIDAGSVLREASTNAITGTGKGWAVGTAWVLEPDKDCVLRIMC